MHALLLRRISPAEGEEATVRRICRPTAAGFGSRRRQRAAEGQAGATVGLLSLTYALTGGARRALIGLTRRTRHRRSAPSSTRVQAPTS